MSAVTGACVRLVLGRVLWLSAGMGMSLALLAMQLTRTTHPPGGATALIAASLVHVGPWAGFRFVLTVTFGSLLMLLVALLVNNISPSRRWIGDHAHPCSRTLRMHTYVCMHALHACRPCARAS